MRGRTILTRAIIALAFIATVTGIAAAQSGAAGGTTQTRPSVFAVTINPSVRDAQIYVDGVLQRRGTVQLERGTYVIRVEARGYMPWEQRITITGPRTITVSLVPPTATVVLRIPSEFLNDRIRDPWREIDFYVDGRLRNEARVEVEPGRREIMIVSGGLQFRNFFTFEAGRTYTIELLLRASLLGG